MQYTTLGSTGLVVSRLGLGALTFTGGNRALASVYKVGADLAQAFVDRAIDAGINLFDTADVYADGESEELLGRALKSHRERIVLSTKVGSRGSRDRELLHAGLSRRHILWSIDRSLQRLGTDRVDVYIAHCEDPFTPLEETLEAFDAVVRAGKARYIGFSNWSAWTVSAAMEIQKARGLVPFSHGQMYYSLLGRDVERDMIPMMRRYGLGLNAWSPLAYGFLSGAYTREDLAKPDNRFSSFDMLRFDRERGFALLDVMRGIASVRRASVAQVAIAWLLSRKAVGSVLLGATKLEQLDQNLGALNVTLADEDLAALDAASAIVPAYPSTDWIVADRLVAKALRR